MNMKIAGLVAVIALLAGPAWAQTQPHVQGPGEPDKDKTAAEIANEKEAERAYKRSLGNIQEQKTADPWGTVRSDNATPKAGAKAAPSKPKTPKTAAKPETSAKQ
jgi:hypothetical protein